MENEFMEIFDLGSTLHEKVKKVFWLMVGHQ